MGVRSKSCLLRFFQRRRRLYQLRFSMPVRREQSNELYPRIRLVLPFSERSDGILDGRGIFIPFSPFQPRRRSVCRRERRFNESGNRRFDTARQSYGRFLSHARDNQNYQRDYFRLRSFLRYLRSTAIFLSLRKNSPVAYFRRTQKRVRIKNAFLFFSGKRFLLFFYRICPFIVKSYKNIAVQIRPQYFRFYSV